MAKPMTAADRIVLEGRIIDDPSMSDAELIHQRRQRPDRVIGKVGATGNAMSRIGALCHVRQRERHHEQAAERFKSMYEGLYGSGMPAIDAGRVQVDRTIIASDGGMARRIDKATDLHSIMKSLGRRKDLVIAVVVLGESCENFAALMPSGQRNQRQVDNTRRQLLDALNDIAKWTGAAA